MSDYSRGVEAASAIYQETINEYVQENDKLRELVRGFMKCPTHVDFCKTCEHARVIPKSVTGNWDMYICRLAEKAHAMGIEVER